jgi:hypothetical protein
MTKQPKANKNKKAAYKVKNWAQYNQSLINRGSLTIWITPEVLESWKDQRPAQRGAQFAYSDLAIEALLTLKFLLKLPYRAAQGFGQSLFNLLEIELPMPNYTTLSRRAKTLNVALPRQSESVRHIVMDATGLKVYGEGEWKVRKHGYSKRRTWRKLHLSIDPDTQEIVVAQLTPNSVTDGQAGVTMLRELPNTPDQVTGDGGYDKRPFYQECQALSISKIVVPPQRNAKIWQHGNCKLPAHPRDENLRYIRRHGRKKWKRDYDYHQRSLVETTMFRYKRLFGADLQSRSDVSQSNEARLKCAILNRMTALGLPDSYKVVNV